MFDEVVVTSWIDLRDRLEGFSSTAIFRGQSDALWKLETSLERRCREADRRQGYEAYQQHVFESSAPRLGVRAEMVDTAHGPHCVDHSTPHMNTWAVMQHHGAPTRLLDWSASPFVGLFFAAEHGSTDFAVFVLDREELEMAAGSILGVEPHRIGSVGAEFMWPSNLWTAKFNSGETKCVVVMDPTCHTDRIFAQQGRLLAPACLSCPFEENLKGVLDEVGEARTASKLVVPAALRDECLRRLWKMNVSRASLFPGIDGLASSLAHMASALS